MQITLIDAEAVHAHGDDLALMDAIAEGHHGERPHTRRILYDVGGDERFMALPAWAPGQAIGIKTVTIFPGNLARGGTSVQALYTLFDGTDGRPLALLDGTALTYRKTAADSGLGARHLARDDARVLLVVGAGGLAPHLVRAHRAARPSIDRVLVHNRTRSRADALAAEVDGIVVDDLATAVAGADVISLCVPSREPLLHGEWLTPGTHVDAVGAYTPDLREIDDEVVRRASIHVDSWEAAVEEHGNLVVPLASGVISRDDIRGDLEDLVAGRCGRADADEITLYVNGGGGHLDLMCARHIHAAVMRREERVAEDGAPS